MDKIEKKILKIFTELKIPVELENGINNTLLLDSIYGLIDRALHNEKISMNEIKDLMLLDNIKKLANNLDLNIYENLLFYNLLKSCYLILENISNLN